MSIIKRIIDKIKNFTTGHKIKTSTYPDPSYSRPSHRTKNVPRGYHFTKKGTGRVHKDGQGKLGQRGHDGTMYGPFRSRVG